MTKDNPSYILNCKNNKTTSSFQGVIEIINKQDQITDNITIMTEKKCIDVFRTMLSNG